MALLPVPQKASTIKSQRHRSAKWAAIFSGVALNQPSARKGVLTFDFCVLVQVTNVITEPILHEMLTDWGQHHALQTHCLVKDQPHGNHKQKC